jgi:hypothetical protein
MHSQTPVTVTGVFFQPIDYEQLVSMSNLPTAATYDRFMEEGEKLIRTSEMKFRALCDSARISYSIHDQEKDWSSDLLIKETRFADLLVISAELFCSNVFAGQPNIFMRDTLHKAECPVVIVPEDFRPFNRTIIAYDGRKESMFALRQFCYLFPQWTSLPTEIVFLRDESNEDIPDIESLKEYTRHQFGSLNISKLHFTGRKYFASWMEEKKDVMLVTGAFSRPAISNVLHRSFADQLITDHNAPIFLAHNV